MPAAATVATARKRARIPQTATPTDKSKKAKAKVERDAVYTVQELNRITGIGLNALYTAVRSGEIAHQKRGRAYYVLGAAVQSWLIGQPAA